MQVIVEDPPSSTLLYDGNISPDQHEDMKRALYRDVGMRHWINNW